MPQPRSHILVGIAVILLGTGCGIRSNSHVAQTPALPPAAATASMTPTIQPTGIRTVAFGPAAAQLATGSVDGTVVLWNVSDGVGEPIRQFEQVANLITCLEFSPDGAWLAGGGADNAIGTSHIGGETVVYVWNVSTGELAYELTGHTDGITDVSWSPDGSILASASDDGSIWVWNVDTKEVQLISEQSMEAKAVSWSPDGRLVAGGGFFFASLVDVASGASSPLPIEDALILDIAFSPDGSRVAGGESWGKDLGLRYGPDVYTRGWVHIWDAQTGESLSDWEYDIGVNTVAWSPDGHMLAIKTFESDVIVWNVEEGVPVYRSGLVPATHSNIAWSSDGKLIAWASPDGSLALWSVGQEHAKSR